MKYALLIYEDEGRWTTMSEAAQGAEVNEYRAFGKQFGEAIKGGEALQPTASAKTTRVRNGKPVTTDGPFAETKEQLGGFYLVEAGSIAEALAMAEKIPGARVGSVEVRPIMTFS